MKRFLIIMVVFISSCSSPFHNTIEIEESVENRSFNYETIKEVIVEIETIYSNVPIDVYYNNSKSSTLISDSNGFIYDTIILPTYINDVVLRTDYLGLPNSIAVTLDNDTIEVDYRYLTSNSSSRNINEESFNSAKNFNTLGSWNYLGVPNYLIDREELSQDFIDVLNSLLPEKQPVPEYNPQYLENEAVTDIHITESAEVFVTFIHEGAGYKNSLGFFTYDTVSGPPNNVRDRDITIIFPNVSYENSGGGLNSGDKVKIGTFEAGTSIGWVIIADGYSLSNSSVGSGKNTFYSVDYLNPEDPNNNQHVVQIDFEERVVFSFEDLPRTSGDNDFNDAIFSVDSNPLTAINRNNIVKPEESPTIDSDGDGVIDSLDYKPQDSSISSADFYPSENEVGALAYEDLWPYMGDYDFNDLVINLSFIEEKNNNGDIVKITGQFNVKGIVASMRNGFAFELGVASNKVKTVTGGEFSRGYIERGNNGTELRQELAVIGVFEDANLHYDNNSNIEVLIEFEEPISREELGYPPYNPFVISNGERGREVHLPGKSATELAHLGYFLTQDDKSTFTDGNSYKTEDNSPWALHVPSDFSYPKDDKRIDTVYNYFNAWVESNGENYSDWYLHLEGYVNSALLFNN